MKRSGIYLLEAALRESKPLDIGLAVKNVVYDHRANNSLRSSIAELATL